MPTIGPTRATFLDSFRAVTIVMVVAIHAGAKVELAPAVEPWVTFIISSIAVPSFFMCDGYLLVLRGAARMRSSGYLDYVRRSARRLLIPWLAFSLLYTAARALFEAVGVLDQHVVVGHSLWQIIIEIYSSGIAPQMYFLASLFLIRTAGWATRSLAESNPVVPWICFFGYGFLYRSIWAIPLENFFSTGFDPVLHAAWGLQFYLLGIALARSGSIDSWRAGALSIAAWTVLGAILGFDRTGWWPAGAQYSYLLGAFFGFVALGDCGRWLARFGQDSMGIYLLHAPLILHGVGLLLSPFAGVVDSPLALYLSICASATGFSWLGTRMLKALPCGRWLLGMSDGT